MIIFLSTELPYLSVFDLYFNTTYSVAAEPNLKESTARKKIYDKCDKTGADGVLVRGGFGDGGVQGKILAAKYAREHSVPFLGICLGMQIVVNE
ncbi:hypothetical protein LR48_Vigan431s000600 [Vigna angularis]|uniref:CTP synthase (glutamine hydrolyzing) n=1 Tax=Phaseolus angularis TaxID=3914 RepID=A0A0L9TAE6_PHAAN|nr:hypothetical protein LR48_Vigan431s000600 [Vigna angularis]